jgi:hypothetical protein
LQKKVQIKDQLFLHTDPEGPFSNLPIIIGYLGKGEAVEELEPVDQLVVEGVLLQPAVQQVGPGRPPLLQASGSWRGGSEYVVNLLKMLQNMQLWSYSVRYI